MRKQLDTDQKALEINLDSSIYGTFAEIGAGQEVARYFFSVGAAAGTIAKTMSAYDKTFSDAIYGTEPSGRYVCESRLYKMLDHEYELMEDRLGTDRPDTNFFVFADTVAAINYSRTIKGNGWLGVRFQLKPGGESNDLVIHVKMLDNDNQLQQQAIGILGVNLIYGVFRYARDPETLLQSLMDNLHGRVKIDMVRLTGPDFDVDNRLLSLMLVKHGLTDVAMFGPNGQNLHASEFLYKKYVMVVRGAYRPPTLVNMDVLRSGFQQFKGDERVNSSRAHLLAEMTLEGLKDETGEINEQDFLDRAVLLNAIGQTVVITANDDYQSLINYLTDFKVQHLGFVIGVDRLLEMISRKYYKNQDGRLLAAFGEVFTHNVTFYVYPGLQEGVDELIRSENLPVPEGVKFLYRHLLDSYSIVDIEEVNTELLYIFSDQVLQFIRNGEPEWEQMVPPKVSKLIKEKYLFGYPMEKIEFDY